MLREFLKRNKTLKVLNLGKAKVEWVEGNYLQEKGMAVICAGLKTNKSVISLNAGEPAS